MVVKNITKIFLSSYYHLLSRCGKCIGDLNIKAFYTFLNVMCFQFYYLVGVLVYFLISRYSVDSLPTGPGYP